MIQGDARRLKQILVNLLSNAVKFTPEGGQVGLEVMGDLESEVLHFIVWDTGIGIPPHYLSRLFRPFVQIDSSLARQYEGSGLGLALVYRLAELHRGSISVESEVDQGSRFTVSLPWQRGGAPVTPAEAVEAGSEVVPFHPALEAELTSQPLILLAEDNEATLEVLTDYLIDQGYRLAVARTGLEAIARAREERPALILMDVQMPGLDGLEAMRYLRAEADFAQIPIIALTALTMPGDRERCLAAGANDYLSKPVSLKHLVSTIEMHLKPVKI
jgi:CheY-like chemotaxis protein